MTTSDHPFAASAAASNGSQPPNQARLALDNLLRRELKVSDPNDAKAVATALMDRYKNNPRARAIQSEAQGLPFTTAPVLAAPSMAMASTSDGEFNQAVDDVERGLKDLTTNSLLGSFVPELQGWASTIRSLIQEGSAAAPMALDVSQRDKAFGIRRSLGDFARLARLVGLLTPAVNVNYRKLAQGLDEVRAVLLVKMGEALAAGSYNGNRYLMQAPYTELQARRDAVIHALRNLVGSTQFAYDADTWPRGLDAYGDLYRELESRGQADLRALLSENELSRIMDSLIQRAASGDSDGLRGLGATAQLDLQRFLRFIVVGKRIVKPISPPMNTFLKAMEVFRDAFTRSSGIRLLHISRPQILFYGLYGSGGPSEGTSTLQKLVETRGNLASEIDCISACCATDNDAEKYLVALDKGLSDLDRAIDLFCLSNEEANADDGISPEGRAKAYGMLLGKLYDKLCYAVDKEKTSQQVVNLILTAAETINKYDIGTHNEEHLKGAVREELAIQHASEEEWESMARAVAPTCDPCELFEIIEGVYEEALEEYIGKGSRDTIRERIKEDLRRRTKIDSPQQADISLENIDRDLKKK
jgi:hypothetical protein